MLSSNASPASHVALSSQIRQNLAKVRKKGAKAGVEGMEATIAGHEKAARDTAGIGEAVMLLAAARMRKAQGNMPAEADDYVDAARVFAELELDRFRVGLPTLDQDIAKAVLAGNLAVKLYTASNRRTAAYCTASYLAATLHKLGCDDAAATSHALAAETVRPPTRGDGHAVFLDQSLYQSSLLAAFRSHAAAWDVPLARATGKVLLHSLLLSARMANSSSDRAPPARNPSVLFEPKEVGEKSFNAAIDDDIAKCESEGSDEDDDFFESGAVLTGGFASPALPSPQGRPVGSFSASVRSSVTMDDANPIAPAQSTRTLSASLSASQSVMSVRRTSVPGVRKQHQHNPTVTFILTCLILIELAVSDYPAAKLHLDDLAPFSPPNLHPYLSLLYRSFTSATMLDLNVDEFAHGLPVDALPQPPFTDSLHLQLFQKAITARSFEYTNPRDL
ncbi:hypothetical protein DIPPA_06630 [Diplonema papillatum]|nr:hypothetical protein DIPPA_06630 [Diplonema papillatum]